MNEIRNSALVGQVVDFSGFRGQLVRRIIPTDIDAFMEFEGRLFIGVEYKYHLRGKNQETAQRVCFERLVMAIDHGQVRAFFLLAEHETAPDKAIDGAEAIVFSVYGRLSDGTYSYEPGNGWTVLRWCRRLYHLVFADHSQP